MYHKGELHKKLFISNIYKSGRQNKLSPSAQANKNTKQNFPWSLLLNKIM